MTGKSYLKARVSSAFKIALLLSHAGFVSGIDDDMNFMMQPLLLDLNQGMFRDLTSW